MSHFEFVAILHDGPCAETVINSMSQLPDPIYMARFVEDGSWVRVIASETPWPNQQVYDKRETTVKALTITDHYFLRHD